MAIGPALFTGLVGSTGGVTGPHAHFQLYKNGKLTPLSSNRSDVGRNIQFRLPGTDVWEYLYNPRDLVLNPKATFMEGMGVRSRHPVTGARNVPHRGEDIAFPEGTALRYLGQGSVTPMANVGAAGNISSVVSGPFKLETFHLSQLPQQSTTATALPVQNYTPPPAPVLPPPPTPPNAPKPEEKDSRTRDLLEAFLYGARYRGNEEQRQPAGSGLIAGLFEELLAPRRSFISSYINQEPYLQGQAASTYDYLKGLF